MNCVFVTIFSSAVIAAIVSGITAYIIEKRKFSQEYWKITINNRLDAYEQIEHVLVFFQSSSYINDKPCHMAFLETEYFSEVQQKLTMVTWKRNWISTKVFNEIINLNRLLGENEHHEDTKKTNAFGVDKYSQIEKIRDNILKSTTEDYAQMHKVKDFFEEKKKEYNG